MRILALLRINRMIIIPAIENAKLDSLPNPGILFKGNVLLYQIQAQNHTGYGNYLNRQTDLIYAGILIKEVIYIEKQCKYAGNYRQVNQYRIEIGPGTEMAFAFSQKLG